MLALLDGLDDRLVIVVVIWIDGRFGSAFDRPWRSARHDELAARSANRPAMPSSSYACRALRGTRVLPAGGTSLCTASLAASISRRSKRRRASGATLRARPRRRSADHGPATATGRARRPRVRAESQLGARPDSTCARRRTAIESDCELAPALEARVRADRREFLARPVARILVPVETGQRGPMRFVT